eukprot:7292875-Prymnesium_polylepis.2
MAHIVWAHGHEPWRPSPRASCLGPRPSTSRHPRSGTFGSFFGRCFLPPPPPPPLPARREHRPLQHPRRQPVLPPLKPLVASRAALQVDLQQKKWYSVRKLNLKPR